MVTPFAIPREQIAEFCARHHIRRLALFGSALRDDFRPDSHIDVLVEFEADAKPGLFDLARMQRELSALYGRQADLLTSGFLSPHFRQQALASAQVIYDKET